MGKTCEKGRFEPRVKREEVKEGRNDDDEVFLLSFVTSKFEKMLEFVRLLEA